MSRIISIIAIILLLAGGIFLFVLHNKKMDSTQENQAKAQGPIVVFGDSITAGFGVSKGSDYSSLLQKELGHEVIALGKNGDTTESALTRLDSVLAEKPFLV